ncbi:MAG TPA: hypothetical protein VFV85_06325 [Conexibacter sp.]|nr:hypothetical protein [Conexibacter sp.]
MHAHDDETAIEQERFEELPLAALPPRPRRRLTPLMGVLLAVLLVAGGFVGGVLVQKGQQSGGAGGGGAGAGRFPAALAAARGAGRTGVGAAAGGFVPGGAGATFGTVSTVDGDALYVTDQQGNTLEVTAATGASVTRQVASKVRSIRPGETVIVQGAARRGAIVATSIRATPATGGAGAGGTRGGGAGGGGIVNQLFGGGGAAPTTQEAP